MKGKRGNKESKTRTTTRRKKRKRKTNKQWRWVDRAISKCQKEVLFYFDFFFKKSFIFLKLDFPFNINISLIFNFILYFQIKIKYLSVIISYSGNMKKKWMSLWSAEENSIQDNDQGPLFNWYESLLHNNNFFGARSHGFRLNMMCIPSFHHFIFILSMMVMEIHYT